MAQIKTNAMRILDGKKVNYNVITYENKDGKIDGISVAGKIGKNEEEVYKTLVTKGVKNEIYVFVIPVREELDFKKAAKICREKKIEMINVADINKYTGYIRGGCSPIGMKKNYKTFIHEKVNGLSSVVVSGGKIGVQIEIKPSDLIKCVNAKIDDLIK